jgi:hypothetical protein
MIRFEGAGPEPPAHGGSVRATGSSAVCVSLRRGPASKIDPLISDLFGFAGKRALWIAADPLRSVSVNPGSERPR